MSNIAIVNFRTMANGSYRYMRGKRRGYWRVLIVKNINGPTTLSSHNVIGEHWVGREGIDGVSDRSNYCLNSSYDRAIQVADEFNASIS